MPMPKGRYTRLVRRDSDGTIIEMGKPADKPRPLCKHCRLPMVYSAPVGHCNAPKVYRHAGTYDIKCHNLVGKVATYEVPKVEE